MLQWAREHGCSEEIEGSEEDEDDVEEEEEEEEEEDIDAGQDDSFVFASG